MTSRKALQSFLLPCLKFRAITDAGEGIRTYGILIGDEQRHGVGVSLPQRDFHALKTSVQTFERRMQASDQTFGTEPAYGIIAVRDMFAEQPEYVDTYHVISSEHLECAWIGIYYMSVDDRYDNAALILFQDDG